MNHLVLLLLHVLILNHAVVPCATYADKNIQFYALISSHAKNITHMEIWNLAKEKVI